MSLTTTVGIAASGLKVTQSATALVSANIAGASTDGYTLKTTNTQGIYAATGLVGFTSTVSRAFDQEIFDQLISSTATSSYLDSKNTYLEQINALLGSTETGAALPSALSTFITDLQTLAAQPDSTAAQIQVVNSATVLAQTLTSLSSTVSDLSEAVGTAIKEGVDDVNTLTSQISDLNSQIIRFQSTGMDTSGLEDQRDQAVLKLSTLVDVQVKPQQDGSIRVSTTSGLTLVDHSTATQLMVDGRGAIRIDDGSGTGGEVISSGMITSGALSGLVETRDGILPQVMDQLDQIAAGLASAMSDTTSSGTAVTSGGGAGFDLDASDLQSGNRMTLTYTDTATGETKTVSLVKVTDPSVLPLGDDATLDPNDTVVGIDFSGGPASVAAQIQAALGSNFSVSNTTGDTIRIVDSGAGAVTVDGLTKTVTETDLQSGSAALPLFTDAGTPYTGSFDGVPQKQGMAQRIRVNAAIAADPSLLVDYSSTTQTGDSTRPDALHAALTDGTLSVKLASGGAATTSTISGFANSMVSYWAGRAETQQTLVDNQSIIQSNLQSRMSDASAVNTDTELTKLIQLQSYYSANAQVLSTLRQMLDSLVGAM